MNFKTIMIKVHQDKLSEAYFDCASKTWAGFGLKHFNAVTPDTIKDQKFPGLTNGLVFGKKGNRDVTETEKACFYSQFFLWYKCVEENIPILILEHDAYLVNPSMIKFDPRFDVTYYGQHSMEAVMYHPRFAKRLVQHCYKYPVTGPMALVDLLVGYSRPGKQSRFATPHARFIGKQAPVKSLLDPNLGTTVEHIGGTSTADRAVIDADLFKIVDLKKLGFYTSE